MLKENRKSSLILFGFLFLLPLFFIPLQGWGLNDAKSLLLVASATIMLVVFLFEMWRKPEIELVWHPLLLGAVILPLAYLVSVIFNPSSSSLSLFGYNFEAGTFGYMLVASLLLLLTSLALDEKSALVKAISAIVLSLLIIEVVALVKLFVPTSVLDWGVLSGNTGNTAGKWTDLSVIIGLLSLFSVLGLGMLSLKKAFRVILYCAFMGALVLLAIIRFPVALTLTLFFSIVFLVYFRTVERQFVRVEEEVVESKNFFKPVYLFILLALVSGVFLVNPNIPGEDKTISSSTSELFNTSNAEVRPSFSATLDISKAVLSEGALFGSGPNTFSQNWLAYKPASINTTPFWGVAFPLGIGFIPTQVAETGVLGAISWVAFFALLFALGWKAIIQIPESRILRFCTIFCLASALYLWFAAAMYAPSPVVLTLAFIFTGMFVAACRLSGIIPKVKINIAESPNANFLYILAMLGLSLTVVFIGYVGITKNLSAFYFQRAVNLANASEPQFREIEGALNKAATLAPADKYYVALSQFHFAEAQNIASESSTDPEGSASLFQEALFKSISSARSAVEINPNGYQNWLTLGSVYAALVPPPLSVAGAEISAESAYLQARARNPLSPEVPFLLAQLELGRNNVEAARSYIKASLALKEDYAPAYILLAQIEINQNNVPAAIESAEKISLLDPQNSGLHFEIGILKYSVGDYEGAVNSFSQTILIEPEHANARFYLALALIELGQNDLAKLYLEDLLTANPDSAELKSVLESLE